MKLVNFLKTGLLLISFTTLEVATFSFSHKSPALAAPSCSRPTQMVAWWQFDEVVGTAAVDKSGNNNNGIYKNSLFPSAPPNNGTLKFDGIDDYITVPSTTSLNLDNSNFTVCFNIKTISTTDFETLIDKRVSSLTSYQGWYVYTLRGRLGLQLANGSTYADYASDVFIGDGNWHSVIISINRASTTGGNIYVDDILQYTFDPTRITGSLNNTISLTIGRSSDTFPSFYFKNNLDDIKILKTAL